MDRRPNFAFGMGEPTHGKRWTARPRNAAWSTWLWALTLLALLLRDGRAVQAAAGPHPSAHPRALRHEDGALSAHFAALPLRFEANRGQFDDRVAFLAHGSGYSLFLTQEGATLALQRKDDGESGDSAVLTLRLAGGHSVWPSPSERLEGSSNYFVGNDPSKWRTGVEGFARVRYPQVLPGVDIVYYGTGERRLEYDVVLAPGADPNGVALAFEGAQSVEIGREGAALLRLHGGGEILQPAPVAYQVDAAGRRIGVDVRYVQREGGLGFEVGRFDGRRALVIDPTLVYSTYLGGLGSDGAYGVALGGDGAAFVAGTTTSTNFPTASAAQASNAGGHDTFVAKVNAAGSALVYATYLGGTGDDFANGIAIDSSGEAFVTGFTSSTNFPTTASPVQGAYGGGPCDAFVTKLSATGSGILYSTYIGGSVNDQAAGIAVDSGGEAFVTGSTTSTNFPTLSSVQAANRGGSDAFLAKLNASGSGLVYSTYLGGSGADAATGVALDGAGEAFVVGNTASSNFPVASPFRAALGGSQDAFVAKFNSAGSAIVYSTYLGGSGADSATGVAIDAAGEAFVTGITASLDFPTASPLQTASGGKEDVFVTNFAADGSALVYSTYLGGGDNEQAYCIAVDAVGEAVVAGETASTNFPTASPLQGAYAGGDDAFVARVMRSSTASAVPALGTKGPLLAALLLLGGVLVLVRDRGRNAHTTRHSAWSRRRAWAGVSPTP